MHKMYALKNTKIMGPLRLTLDKRAEQNHGKSKALKMPLSGDILHQLLIPFTHFTSCIPERAVNGNEISKFVLLQCQYEVLPLHAVTSDHPELVCDFGVEFVVPSYIVATMQEYGFCN